MRQATVYQVAQYAGVSIATVSRVHNGSEKANAIPRDRILSAIDALGFASKAEAAARARKGSGRGGVLIPFLYLLFVGCLPVRCSRCPDRFSFGFDDLDNHVMHHA